MKKVYRPDTLGEVLQILSSERCTIFSGGTDLMVKKGHWLRAEAEGDRAVVFISDLIELRNIEVIDNETKIGAACTCSQIIESQLIPEYIKNIFRKMASPGIRNIATIGGNICNASPAGDSLPLLYAMEASLIIHSLYGVRELPIEEFIISPGKNSIKENEILVEIKIPKRSFNVRTYKKVGTRRATAISKLSFVGLADVADGKLYDIRLTFGAVGPTVVRSKAIEKEIVDMSKQGRIDIESIKHDYANLIKPIDDQRSTAFYRKEVCLRLLEDFLKKL